MAIVVKPNEPIVLQIKEVIGRACPDTPFSHVSKAALGVVLELRARKLLVEK